MRYKFSGISNLFLLASILSWALIITVGCTGGGGSPAAPNVVPDGTKILIANSLGETLSSFSFQEGTYVAQNDLAPTGQAPNQIVIKGSVCYILNSLSNSILALDSTTFNLIYESSVGLGKNPYNMAFINNDEVIITNWLGNDCVRMNVNPSYASDRILATIPLPESAELPKDATVKETAACPQAVVVIGDTAYVTLANLETKNFTAGGPGLIALIDLQSNQMLSTIQTTGRNTQGFCIDPFNNQKLYVLSAGDINPSTWLYNGNGKIDIFDTGTLGITSNFSVVAAPSEMVIAPTGIAYITDLMEGRILTFNTSTRFFGGVIDIAKEGTLSYVSGLTLLGSDFLFALEFNQDELVVIDIQSGNAILDRIKTGDGPDALVLLP